MEKDEFVKQVTDTLTHEWEIRGLKTLGQINTFVTHALVIKYGSKTRLNVSEIVARVYTNLRTRIKDLPDELHGDFKSVMA
jgi:hypothetical protein